jgi:hypothetical protein
VVASAVAAVTSTSESTHCALADGLGLGEGLADAPADALAAGSGDSPPESSSGSGDMDNPKLGEALGSWADGSSLDPKAAWSNHHPNHRTTSRPTMTVARRRQ